MIKLTGIYGAIDVTDNDAQVVKFSGQIDNETLLSPDRNDQPDKFYIELGKQLVAEFNRPENWI